MNERFKYRILGFGILVGCIWQTACTPQWLFQHKENEAVVMQKIKEIPYEHILQADDKIILSIWGHDDLGVGSSFSVYSSTLDQGKYISIDNQGEITLPLIGKVKIAGLTAREADLYIARLYSKYLKNPIVYLRALNNTITLLGEVNTPGNYVLDKERKSLLEIIGDAGGFTNYADKTQIKILRRLENAEMEEIQIDLTEIETLYEVDISLRSRDVIYIPERRAKQFESVVSGKIAPVVGVIGSIAILLSLIQSNQ